MEHDARLLATRAFRAGVQWAVKEMTGGVAEGQDKALAMFLARETFDDEETRRLVEGALRVER